jgi:hypothetical protein
MYLLNESNFRKRFPACTEELRRKARLEPIVPGAVEKDTSPSEAGLEALEMQEVETVTGILDIKGVGLMSFWKVKDLLTQVIQISDVSFLSRRRATVKLTFSQNYYPETSNRMVKLLLDTEPRD